MDRRESTIPVYGMTCDHCVKAVTEALEKLEGVEKVRVSLSGGEAVVSYDPSRVKIDDMDRAIEDAGYSTSPTGEESEAVKAAIRRGIRIREPGWPQSGE